MCALQAHRHIYIWLPPPLHTPISTHTTNIPKNLTNPNNPPKNIANTRKPFLSHSDRKYLTIMRYQGIIDRGNVIDQSHIAFHVYAPKQIGVHLIMLAHIKNVSSKKGGNSQNYSHVDSQSPSSSCHTV